MPDPCWSNPKFLKKKFKNLKNVILASFLAKLGRDRSKMRIKKISFWESFLLNPGWSIPKKNSKKKKKNIYIYSKKIQKI